MAWSAVLASSLALAACGDDDCGPGDALADGVMAEVDGTQLSFGSFTSSPNNDCPAGGPTSLTIEARQTGTSRPLVLCLPRPDMIDAAAIELADTTLVQVIDAFADVGDCLASIDRSRDLTGTVTFSGFCDNGSSSAGYAISFDGAIPVTLMCPVDGGAGSATTQISLSGSASVSAL